MPYRVLTPDEVIQLAREYENLRRWEAACEFALMLFGPQAQQITITVMSQYNDFRYDDEVSMVVLDKQGKPLKYDYTLSWWSQFPLSHREIAMLLDADEEEEEQTLNVYRRVEDSSQINDAIAELFAEKIGIELVADGSQHDLITLTFHVEKPPAISNKLVYVKVDEDNYS